jgi:hypothetical protein
MVLPYPLGLLRVILIVYFVRLDASFCFFGRDCLYIFIVSMLLLMLFIFLLFANFWKILHSYCTVSVIQSVFTGVQKLRKGRMWRYECPLKINIIQNGWILPLADAIFDANNQFHRFSSKLFKPIISEQTEDRFQFSVSKFSQKT